MDRLVERCRELASGTTTQQQRAWKDLIRAGGLWDACRERVKAENGWTELSTSYEHLMNTRVQIAAKSLHSHDPDEAAYLCGAAQRLVAAGVVTALARHATALTDLNIDTELPEWAFRATTLQAPTSPLPPMASNFSVHRDARRLISHAFDAVAPVTGKGEGWSSARVTALELLDRQVASRRFVNIPILLVDRNGKGEIAYLSVWQLDGGSGHLCRAPWMLRAFEQDWREALAEAWGRVAPQFANVDLLWEIHQEETVPFDGKSAQAAFQAALELLAAGSLIDTNCAISATVVDAQGRLGPVNGIVATNGEPGPKLVKAAEPTSGIKHVLISSQNFDQLHPPNSALRRQDGMDRLVLSGGLEVIAAPTLQDAMQVVSSTAIAVRDYLQKVRDAPQAEDPPAYMGARKLADLYIEPDVLKRERKAVRMSGPEDAEMGAEDFSERSHSDDPRDHLAAEARDIGELLYGEGRPEEEWRRTKWTIERSHITHAVLLAPPGQGKTLLTQMTAREIAQEALDQIERQQISLDEAPLPIVIRLNLLAGAAPSVISEGQEGNALRLALKAALTAMGHAGSAAQYLADHAHEKRAWLLLDALDEVENRGPLKRLFSVLKQSEWQCRVVLTSRPYGYSEGEFSVDFTMYRLAEFDRKQARDFTETWFKQDRRAKQRMLPLITRHSAVQRLSQNPFLMTLLCWVVEEDSKTGAPAGADPFARLTRTQLYERVISDLLGLKPGKAEVDKNVVDKDRADSWIATLGPIALTHFLADAGRHPLPHTTLKQAIADSENRPVPLKEDWTPLSVEQAANLGKVQQAEFLIQELRRKRFLVPLTPKKQSDESTRETDEKHNKSEPETHLSAKYALPHRSLLEFLTGWALAQLANARGWNAPVSDLSAPGQNITVSYLVDRKSWLAAWEEVIQFLAGCLDDPIPLLELLSDGRHDDYFRHRLAVAALCLPEIVVA